MQKWVLFEYSFLQWTILLPFCHHDNKYSFPTLLNGIVLHCSLFSQILLITSYCLFSNLLKGFWKLKNKIWTKVGIWIMCKWLLQSCGTDMFFKGEFSFVIKLYSCWPPSPSPKNPIHCVLCSRYCTSNLLICT